MHSIPCDSERYARAVAEYFDTGVGDVSVEINVEELVAEIEASQGDDAHKKKEMRRRLEEIQEQKHASDEIGDTFNIDLNEDD